MVPETFPILTADDIIEPPTQEYEDEATGQKSTVGWLKSLYLFGGDGDYLIITDQDRRDYAEAEKVFREVNNIPRSVDLHDWEQQKSRAKQATALNKFRRKMGYVVST